MKKTSWRRFLSFLIVAAFFLPAVYQLAAASPPALPAVLQTETPTPTPDFSPTPTDTPLPTSTNTPLPTDTSTPIVVPSNTPTWTNTPVQPSPTPTDTPTPNPTNTPVPDPTDTPPASSTPPPTPTATSLPSSTPTFTMTPQPTNTATPAPTQTPVPTATPVPSDTPVTHTPTNTPSPPTPTPPQPTVTPTMPGPTSTSTPPPTATTVPFTTVFMPVLAFNSSAGEPNNNCQEAFNILPVIVHQFYPNDASDWYQFQLESGGNLTVMVSNFVPLAGQVAVYRGSKCGNAVFLGSNGDFSSTKSINLGIQPEGKYFIFVSNDGPLNNVAPYNLQVRFVPLN